MQQFPKRKFVRIVKEEGTRGPRKKKYITYSFQMKRDKDFPYKYITYYPDTDRYEVTGELVSDTEPEIYQAIPQQTVQELFYKYQAEEEIKDKIK